MGVDSVILTSSYITSKVLSALPTSMAASLSLPPPVFSPAPLASYPRLVPACVLSLHTSLPLLFPPSGVSLQYLCLISSPSILKYHLKTYVSPTHTPFNFLSAFIDFILWLPSALNNPLIHSRKLLYKRLWLHLIWKTVISQVWNIS